ncbi:cystin-1 [Athene noctua]|uniref:cystin-1 n=1 Tax=Athene noctua TaxID=126797 RepID=UPI003EB75083
MVNLSPQPPGAQAPLTLGRAQECHLSQTKKRGQEKAADPRVLCEEAAALPAPGRRAPAGGRCGELAAGGGGGGGGGPPPEQAAVSSINLSGPENNADHQCPQRNSKKPAGKSTISYDYSEEELMASIEREYCR